MAGTGASKISTKHWIAKLLLLLGAPLTRGNVTALQLWARQEAAPPAANNPLNTSLRTSDAVYNRGGPIPSYKTADGGVAATYATLTKTVGVGYPPIVEALRHDLGLLLIYRAINASKWCDSQCGPHYPMTLYIEAQKHPQFLTGGTAGNVSITTPAPAPSDEALDYHHKIASAGQTFTTRAGALMTHGRAIRGLLKSRTLP